MALLLFGPHGQAAGARPKYHFCSFCMWPACLLACLPAILAILLWHAVFDFHGPFLLFGSYGQKKISRAARAKGEKRKEKEGGLIKVRYGPLGPSTLINKGSSTQCNMGMFVSEKKNRPADAGSFLFLKR